MTQASVIKPENELFRLIHLCTSFWCFVGVWLFKCFDWLFFWQLFKQYFYKTTAFL